MNVPPGVRKSVDAYNELHATGYKIMQLWDSRVKDVAGKLNDPQVDIVVKCNFANDDAITEALVPYRDQLLAITCRQEQSLARFTRIIPHVPYLPAPTTESITWAADKYLMRKRFQSYDPSITPPFALIKKNSKADRKAVIDQVGFPMIVKPTNMVASLFVKICYHEEELEQATRYILRKLKVAYEADNRLEEPQIIAESYMDGDMYSVDSYVDMQGTITHCPLVRVRTGRDIGHDDFYNYLQVTPSALKDATVEKARHAAEQAIRALGLRSSLAHVELMKIDDEWKVIEVGARMGGFRHLLHKLSCGIDHSMNDILVRIPQKPIVPEKCTGYACAMKWFAAREGKITEMKGIKKIEELESFHSIAMNKKIGDRAVFSKNGGRSVFNLFMHNADRAKLLADIRRVEQLVEVKVARRKKPVKPVSTDAAPVVAKSTNMTNQATPKKKGAASAGTATKKPAKTKS
jgi:biotin carboxylase